MELNILCPEKEPAVPRAHVITMAIKSFKGRRNVEVHLYRVGWKPEEMDAYDWDHLLGEPMQADTPIPHENSKKVLLEAFTPEERDQVVAYLQQRYGEKLASISACALDFPIPKGLAALSDVPEGKSVGRIRLETVPQFTLPFPVHGLYDLSQHEPLMEANGREAA
ncbi:hypothetical protein [Desulfonatronum sp. SC1]|uniref:hypothetical protein n=1 Tax=Desulfonatronum sp. SC1 TaxID=2109626 RepID=UPI000D304661|nr:hypothetical protein [Desulfonatronum sp. SC1]PTN38270.1 hypothetical protein C6366_03405 [Desulfonatronum sp. SC1]